MLGVSFRGDAVDVGGEWYFFRVGGIFCFSLGILGFFIFFTLFKIGNDVCGFGGRGF